MWLLTGWQCMSPLLSPKELAAILGVAEQTIYNRRFTGRDLPPYLKIGKLVRFRSEDIEAWIERSAQAEKEKKITRTEPTISLPVRRRGRPTKPEEIAMRRAR